MARTEGVPLKLLKEFKDEKITVEASCGEVYAGILLDAKENFSVTLGQVRATLTNGAAVAMERVYVRGSRIRFISRINLGS